jgi:8-oxo-dGTP diphosphatase
MVNVQEESFGVIPLSCNEKGAWSVLLILHRGGRHWGFPKGRGHPGESPLAAARRELQEETGLSVVRVLSQDPLVEKYSFQRKSCLVRKTARYFPALVEGEIHLQTEEVEAGQWVPLESASAILTFKEARAILAQLQQFLRHYVV